MSSNARAVSLLLLSDVEREYVAALNAVLGARDDASPDAYRWRGHAEAYRLTATRLRRHLELEPVDYASSEWRDAHGVYRRDVVAAWRRDAAAERAHEQRDCRACGTPLDGAE